MNGKLFPDLISLGAALLGGKVQFGFVYEEATKGHRIYLREFEDAPKFRQALINAGAKDTGSMLALWDSVFVPIELDVNAVIETARKSCK